MDYDLLLEGCCEMGRQLLECGAEIPRVEDTVHRLLAAHGLEGEVFAIPNCLWVSVPCPDGRTRTVMRRVRPSAVDIEGIERFNDLSRRLCAAPPEDPAELLAQCRETAQSLRRHPAALCLFGYFLGAFFFALFFSGGWAEAMTAGLAGLACGACLTLLGLAGVNSFLSTLAAAFVLSALACGAAALGAPVSREITIAGAIMVLVPGLVFTNFMSDLLTGDMVAGLATFARAVLSAGAIALGAGSAMSLFREAPPLQAGAGTEYAPLLYCIFAFVACLGFCPAFNAQGVGGLLCCFGGALGWAFYLAGMEQPLRGQPHRRHRCGGLLRVDGPAEAVSGHVLSGHRHVPAGAGADHLSGHGLRPPGGHGPVSGDLFPHRGHRRVSGAGAAGGVVCAGSEPKMAGRLRFPPLLQF